MSDEPRKSKTKMAMEDWKKRRDDIMQMGGGCGCGAPSQEGTADGQGKGGVFV